MSGGKRDFLPPVPDDWWMPKIVQAYMNAKWARGRVSLLDFLRKITDKCEMIHRIRKSHQGRNSQEFDDFASTFRARGEKIVAAETLSR